MNRLLAVTLGILMLGAISVLSHHSFAGYDRNTTTFEARVESMRIENPHSVIAMRGADGQRYVVIWVAAAQLRQFFPAEGPDSVTELIKLGEWLTVTGRFKRDTEVIEVAAGRFVHRSRGQIYPKPLKPAN
jgi:hypothetical protein